MVKKSNLKLLRLNFNKYLNKRLEEKWQTIRENSVKVKLPKLIISKIQGKSLYCLRFQSQFKTEIDLLDVTIVSNFLHLKV